MDENLRGGVFKHGGLAWPKHAYANHILQCVLFLWTTLGPAQRWKVTGSGWHHIQWGKCCGRRLTQVDLHKLDAEGWKKVAVHFVLVVQQTNCPNGLSRTVYPNPKFQNFLPMFGPVKKNTHARSQASMEDWRATNANWIRLIVGKHFEIDQCAWSSRAAIWMNKHLKTAHCEG